MKIGIIGAGAMGSIYGAVLAEQGHEVHFVDIFQEHVDRVNEDGLRITDSHGEERLVENIQATTDADSVGPVDLAIVFVKSTVTEAAVLENKSLFDENTLVVTLQNGVGNIEKIATVVEESQIIPGTSANGGSLIEAGWVNHAGSGGTTIGELSGEVTERVKDLQELFHHPALGPCTISENVIGLIWDKLLVNVGINPLTALTGLRNGQLLENETSLRLLEAAVAEAITVAEANNIALSYGGDDYVKAAAEATADNKSSMLMDVLNQRKTEIENINGAVIKAGASKHIPTPVNQLLTDLITLKEASYLETS